MRQIISIILYGLAAICVIGGFSLLLDDLDPYGFVFWGIALVLGWVSNLIKKK